MQEVSVAKERIAELSKISDSFAHKPTFGKIQIPTKPGNGVLSPDGKKLAFVSKRSIWVVPVKGKVSPDIAGEPSEPVRLPGTEGAWRWGMSWSADGKWIAYNVLRDNRTVEINVISSTGGEPKKIPVNANRGNHVLNYRLGLSPDGKVLAFTSIEEEGTDKPQEISICTIPVEGGTAKRLTAPGTREPAFSPDGKKIAYVKEGRLWVIPASGGTSVLCSDPPGSARGPVWSPDGKMIAFNHEPGEDNESNEVWIVPVSEDGRAAAAPTKIRLPLSTYDFLAGWTSDNRIGLNLQNPPHRALYTVPASGGNAVQVTPAGWPCHPRWSPDGKRIFFRGDGIASVPSEGGEISIGPLDADSKISEALPGGGNAVSPDGEKIVFSGVNVVSRDNKEARQVDIYTIPIDGGEPNKLTKSPGQDRFPCWSPDGKKIAFIRHGDAEPSKVMSICIVPTEGGKVRQLTSKSHRVLWSTIAWSPNGKSIAYFSDDKAIKVIPVEGGESRVVVNVEDAGVHSELAWSCDGKKIAYSSRGRIWVVSLDGGEPEEVKTGLDAKAAHISLSPDGEKIAFTALKGGDTELWLMENFLPETEPKGMVVRQVWSGPDVYAYGGPSPDGRYFSHTDWNGKGDLAIRELATGKTQRLTEDKKGGKENFRFALNSVISPDGELIAYAWTNEHGTYDLCVIGSDGSGDRTLFSSKDYEIYPTSWSSDSKQIAARKYGGEEHFEIILVSFEDGAVHVLKTFKNVFWPRICYSPDDRFVAYDFPVTHNSGKFDVNVIDTESNGEIALVEHPANDRLLGWAPNSDDVLFTSDRTGTHDMWAIKVTGGKAQGPPRPITRGIGEISPKGFAQDDSFYFSRMTRRSTTQIVPFDPETGKIQEELAKPLLGSNFSAEWSPDGKYLAYVREKTGPQGPGWYHRPLYIRNLKTRKERELAGDIEVRGPRWSPDGRSILVTGHDRNKRGQKGYNGGVYRIDVQDGRVTELVQFPPMQEWLLDNWTRSRSEWASDGKAIFYHSRGKIIKRELESGKEKLLYQNDELYKPLKLSPDGERLAFVVKDLGKGNAGIMVIHVTGVSPRHCMRLGTQMDRRASRPTLRGHPMAVTYCS